MCLNFILIQHRLDNVAEETRNAGGFLRAEPISMSSAPTVGYIKTHITAQVLQTTKGKTRFRTSLNMYFSLLYYSILSMNQEWKIYTKITHLFKSLNSCWVENMCQEWFLSCGRWKMINTWFLKPRSSQSRGGDMHIHL